jgi:hypothetical protein
MSFFRLWLLIPSSSFSLKYCFHTLSLVSKTKECTGLKQSYYQVHQLQ